MNFFHFQSGRSQRAVYKGVFFTFFPNMAVSSICVHHIPCLVTCDPGREGLGKIYDASVVFSSDNIIRYVGRADEAPVDTADKVLDLSVLRGGYVGLPGLVDCHTHSVFAGSRSAEFAERLRGVPYVEILQRGGGILSTVSATRVASKEELTASARARINQFVRNGCTTCEIKSGYGLSVEAEKKILEVVVHAIGLWLFSNFVFSRVKRIRCVKRATGGSEVCRGWCRRFWRTRYLASSGTRGRST